MTSDDGPPHALGLPEILLNIFDCLRDDTGALYSAIQVNKLWFDCGISILWKDPPVEQLANIPEGRRQLFASRINNLVFNGDEEELHPLFLNLEFSRIRSVSIDSCDAEKMNYARAYMRPMLERFEFYGSDVDVGFFDRLGTQCPRLRSILVDSPGDRVTAASFLSFLENSPTLESMAFVVDMHHLLTPDVLLHLASRNNLTELHIAVPIDVELAERILEQTPSPFKDIKVLEVALTSSAVRLLIPRLQGLNTLILAVEDNKVSVLEQLKVLPLLQVLTVNTEHTEAVSVSEILGLKQLVKLESLTLSENIECPLFRDEHFEQLVSSLPHLEELEFDINCSLQYAAFRAVGVNCRKLNDLSGRFSIEAGLLRENCEPGDNQMFPELGALSFARFEQGDPE